MKVTKNISKWVSIVEKAPFMIGIALAAFLPIFIIPTETFSVMASKNALLFIGVLILFLLWGIDRIKNKDFLTSKSLLVVSAYLIPLIYLFSSLFSSPVSNGLIGPGFGTSTFMMIASLFLLMFLISKSFQKKQQVLSLYIGLIASSVVMLLVHIFRLFLGPEFLSLGFLNNPVSNLVGSFNEFGIFIGLIAVLSLITLEYLDISKFHKIFNIVLLGVSLFFVSLVNFNLLWMFLMMVSLFLVVYSLIINKKAEGKINYKSLYKKPSTYVFIVTLIFVLFQGKIGGVLPSMFEISNLEANPTILSTLNIAKSTLSDDPILGVGPSNFVNQWLIHRSQNLNATPFWNVDFNSGSGFVWTSLVTVGLLGFIAWILFLGFITYLGFKLLKISRKNKLDHFIALSLFSLSVYLILFLIFYLPGIAILGLTFLILGVLLSFLTQRKLVKTKLISFESSKIQKISFTTVMVIILGFSLFSGYLFTKKVMASSQFNKGILAINIDKDFDAGYQMIFKAISEYPTALYFRTLTDLNLIKLQDILVQKDVEEKVLQEQFQSILEASVASAQQAIRLNPNGYKNWASLAKVYGFVTPLKIEGVYDNAMQTYLEAIKLNPKNPLLVLNLANLEIAHEDIEKAKEYIGVAIQMKNNYTEAYYMLSQLELNEGNKDTAVEIIEALATVSPNDPQVFLQLGVFKYEDKDYENAQNFLERAVTLNPYFSDAKYLLGLTYGFRGEKDKAEGQFQDLKILNPEDENIETILENIKAGRDPFFGFQTENQPTQEVIENPEEMMINQNIDPMLGEAEAEEEGLVDEEEVVVEE